MKKIQLAKTDASYEVLCNWYDRFEQALPFATETRRITTSFGFTDVMVSEPEAGSSAQDDGIVVLHGALAGAPFPMGELCDLPGRRRIYSVNIPGQSTRAEQVRLDFRTDEYGCWLVEVLDSLGLDRAVICGVSWGGSVALQLAKHFPARIRGMVLTVPGSIVSGPVWQGIWNVAIPMMRFRMFPSEKNRDRAFARILTNGDPLWSPYLGDAVRHWRVDFSVPPLAKSGDFDSLEAPVYVIAADRDLSFPGPKLLDRARELFPDLVGTHLLKNSHHSPSFRDKDRQKFTELFELALERVLNASSRESAQR